MSQKLELLAAEMRGLLQDSQARWVHRRLSRGLEIVLQRNEERWRLALARADTWPANEEIEICRRAFAVPELTAEDYRLTQKGRLFVVETWWREAEKAVSTA